MMREGKVEATAVSLHGAAIFVRLALHKIKIVLHSIQVLRPAVI